MDELDLIRSLRDDAPDPAARETARAALRAQMGAAPGNELGHAPAPPRRWRRTGRLRRLIPATALGIAAVLAIALWPGGPSATEQLAPAAAQALERAASAAEAKPDPVLAPGQYFYVRDRSAYLTISADGSASWSALVPSERETWTAIDGSGRFVARDAGAPTFPGPRDRERWEAAGSPALSAANGAPETTHLGPSLFPAGGSALTYQQLRELPSDGAAMYRRLIQLAKDAGPSPDVEAFTIIGDLLRSAPVPAQARAGLYRAAAYIKGVRYAGEVTDELGRHGSAIELTEPDERRRLVFDPTTSQVLDEQDVLTRRVAYLDADPGYVTGYRLVLEQGIVDGDTVRP